MNSDYSQEVQEHLQPIATFILKTYAILSPENASIVCWHHQGNCFIIKDVNKFTKEILPHHFRHHKYQSFIRQLNMYNFSKVKTGQGSCFANEHFLEGRDDLLRFIKRKPQRKKRRQVNKEESPISKENKENTIKMISEGYIPEKTKDKIENQCEDPVLLKNEFSAPAMKKHVSFVTDLKEVGEQNFSTLMEPSCRWINTKDDSYWQNIKSFKSIRHSMKFLSFQDEANIVHNDDEKIKRLRPKNSFVSFNNLNDN